MSLPTQLSRTQRRVAQRHIARESAKWPLELKEVAPDQWPYTGRDMLKVWRSRDFLVQAFLAPAPAVARLSILRTGLDEGGGWLQNIPWEDLQRLKREAGYGDHEAVEVFPPDRDVVNVANIRHLWVLKPGSLSFVWRAAQ